MGVSKQAAQKRFVPPAGPAPVRAADLFPQGAKPFSRFTDRSARTLAAAGQLAAPGPVGRAHLAAALPVEPEGLAARALAAAGVTPEQLYGAVGAGPAAPVQATSAAELLELSFDDGTRAALTAALKAALRLRHNYIGTEHLLLGLVAVPGPAADALASLGLTAERAEQLIATEVEAARTRKLGRPLGQ